MRSACLFESSIGCCALAWSARGLSAVQLPLRGPARERTLAALSRKAGAAPAEPSAAMARVIRRLQAHLEGRPDRRGFVDLPLDLEGASSFARLVYQRARQVGPGTTISYAGLARLCERPGAARAVGHALARNPLPLVVPCHRVLAADDGLGGFSAPGGLTTKLRLLTLEGADLRGVARQGTRTLGREDPRLAPLIRKVGPFPLLERRRADPFSALVASIIHQQVSMKAGAAIHRRVLALFGQRPCPAALLALTADDLRRVGVSRPKARYLHDLARQSLEGALPFARLARLDDEPVVQTLTRVKGIGRWSAQMFLIFQLGRLDVLPVDDWGLRRGAQRVYGLRRPPSATTLTRLARRWVPFRSIASWYLWRAQDGGGIGV